jgi:hypothetical protein
MNWNDAKEKIKFLWFLLLIPFIIYGAWILVVGLYKQALFRFNQIAEWLVALFKG